MKSIKNSLIIIGLGLVLTVTAQAGELIYKPLNPSFGGDPFVGSYLLGKAQAQDTNKDPNTRSFQSLSST